MTDAPSEEPSADPRDALIRSQAQQIAALEATIADLRERLAAAKRGVAEQRELFNAAVVGRFSRAEAAKEAAACRRSGGEEAPGKQLASPGAAMRWEVPDRTEGRYPRVPARAAVALADAVVQATVTYGEELAR